MKSRIGITVDFQNGNKPVIEVVGKTDSQQPDVRDNLVQSFLQAFQGSSYARIRFELDTHAPGIDYHARAIITPMTEDEVPLRAGDFMSRFKHDDEVDYTTWIKEAEENTPADVMDVLPRYSYGKIVKVAFTKGKVWYDILDDLSGEIVKDIDSSYVKDLEPEYSKRPRTKPAEEIIQKNF